MDWNGMLAWITAAGAVGTAAMGLVQAIKGVPFWFLGRLATKGLGTVRDHLGDRAMEAVRNVYGSGAGEKLLEGAWRRGPEEFATTLRNGLRMAAFSDLPDTRPFVMSFGQDAKTISQAIARLRDGTEGGPGDLDLAVARERVARLEAAIDARVDAAVAAGRDAYVTWLRIAASVLAVGGCVLVSLTFKTGEGDSVRRVLPLGAALLIGVLAVPMAPIAKDVVAFLTSVRTAFQQRRPKV